MKKSKKSEVFAWVKVLAIAVIIAVIVRSFIFTNYVVDGRSMMPTLQNGNRMIVNKLDYDFKQPKRFDIVIFHATSTDDYVKRVIGLPGDSIQYKDDRLYVNGKMYNEPYLKQYKQELVTGNLTNDFTLKDYTGVNKVPKGKVFVLGDNRRNSQDSRFLGFIDMDKIVGKVAVRYLPLDELKWLH